MERSESPERAGSPRARLRGESSGGPERPIAPAGEVIEDDFIRYFVRSENPPAGAPVSFFGVLAQELGIDEEEDSGLSAKNASVEDDVVNLLRVPFEVERVLLIGFLMCFDSLLFVLVLLPLRVARALVLLVAALLPERARPWWATGQLGFHRAQLFDLCRGLTVAVALGVVMQTPMSRIYHYVRGQAFMKLYVIFNMLEIFDRLLVAFGQDILDSLFFVCKTSPHNAGLLLGRLVLATAYVVSHALLFFVRLITLNVAINSTGNALVTLLISNNFIELKGTVFKKTAELNLFQVSCTDIVERFELVVFLGLTLAQGGDTWADFVHNSVFYVCLAEVFVDWIKHAFITKFNKISYTAYMDQVEALCRDIVPVGRHKHPYAASLRQNERPVDPTQAVAQHIGFATLPLACVVMRFAYAAVPVEVTAEPARPAHALLFALTFACLLALKSLVSVALRGHACHTLMRRERQILQRSNMGQPPKSQQEKEQQRGLVATHMQRISKLAKVRRFTNIVGGK